MTCADLSARDGRSFVFYDFETTGVDPAFDQPLQIGAARTDATFAFPDDPAHMLDLRCRRLSHIVPSPGAMLKTRVSPAMLERAPLSFHQMMHQTEAWFAAHAPAIHVGYNSVRFDEAFLRHSLFASLHSPYMTQAPGSTRADALMLAQTIAAMAPDALVVPTGANGKRTFALGPLARANGIMLDEADAHDALHDVRATVALVRLMRDRAPDLFGAALALADKEHVAAIAQTSPVLLHLRTFGGVPQVRALAPLRTRPRDKNALVCLDLAADPAACIDLQGEVLEAWTAARGSPLVTVRLNAHPQVFAACGDAPGLDRLWALLVAKGDAAGGCMGRLWDDLARKVERVRGDHAFAGRLMAALDRRDAMRPRPAHLEQLLYDRFAGPLDYRLGRAMHDVDPGERAGYAGLFEDLRLRRFAARWLHEETPHLLDADMRCRLDAWRRDRLLGPKDRPWRTIAQARKELAQLAEDASAQDAERTAEIATFLDGIEAVALAGLALTA